MLLCLFPMHRCRIPGLVWSLHQTCEALSLGDSSNLFRVFLCIPNKALWAWLHIYLKISPKASSLNRLVDFTMLAKYWYFTTWSIRHPLKYTLNGLVSPNPICLILISFTLIWFSLSNLNIPSICFCNTATVFEITKRSSAQRKWTKMFWSIHTPTSCFR